ncbi:MAG: hypothetical protein ACYCST_00135 [Acidimicrobiales bacterium]
MTAVPRGFHRTNVMGVPQKMDREELAVVTYSVDSLACPRLQIHGELPYQMREMVLTCAHMLRKPEDRAACGHSL